MWYDVQSSSVEQSVRRGTAELGYNVTKGTEYFVLL
jgi:hypothetical protein